MSPFGGCISPKTWRFCSRAEAFCVANPETRVPTSRMAIWPLRPLNPTPWSFYRGVLRCSQYCCSHPATVAAHWQRRCFSCQPGSGQGAKPWVCSSGLSQDRQAADPALLCLRSCATPMHRHNQLMHQALGLENTWCGPNKTRFFKI